MRVSQRGWARNGLGTKLYLLVLLLGHLGLAGLLVLVAEELAHDSRRLDREEKRLDREEKRLDREEKKRL